MLALACASMAAGEVYYIAPDGTQDNDGSIERPWPSVEFALSKVGGGNTIVLLPGAYRGPIRISRAYAGTAGAPTIIRSEVKWKAAIMGSTEHGVYVADNAHWVVIDGLEVFGARMDGIKVSGDNCTVRNCWVHNNSSMGIAIHGRKGWTIENCLVEFNGQHVQFHHGIYADGENYIVRGNVVRHNSGYGMQLYPSALNGAVTNNLIYGHARKGGIVLAAPSKGGNNLIANNTIADNGNGINVMSGSGEVVANNIIVGPTALTGMYAADYNLCRPECVQGAHGMSEDPRFVYASRGAYFLSASSPAMARGSADFAPEVDFWGRPRPKDTAPDLGAFPFVPSLAGDEARNGWYEGWAYRFSPLEERLDMPDLWVEPRQ